MGSEANLFAGLNSTSRAETALRRVRDSYNDLRVRQETMNHGRSDLGPLTGRFDRACRLSKSYYFGKRADSLARGLESIGDFKKVSLSGLDLICSKNDGNGYDEEDDEGNFCTEVSQKKTRRGREDFVETLKRLFDSQLMKYDSIAGSLCSATSSDYSSPSIDNWSSRADESADEGCDFFPGEGAKTDEGCRTSETPGRESPEADVARSKSFVATEESKPPSDLKTEESAPSGTKHSSQGSKGTGKGEEGEGTGASEEKKRMELDIEETMPRLNWDFLEEQLEKAILKEKSSVPIQLRDEILHKMAIEAENDDDDDDAVYDDVDRGLAQARPCRPEATRGLPARLLTPAVADSRLLRRTARRPRAFDGCRIVINSGCNSDSSDGYSYHNSSSNKQLQVCFLNETSIEEDDCDEEEEEGEEGGKFSTNPPERDVSRSEYSTISSDNKSLGVASQATRSSFDSTRSSLHPLPALRRKWSDRRKGGRGGGGGRKEEEDEDGAEDGGDDDGGDKEEEEEDNFFTRQARLQAEARIALAQVRPMSYMQFLLEKQKKKDLYSALQFKLPGIERQCDLREATPQKLRMFNATQLQIVINHLLSEITSLNEELMNLLLERDDLCIVQDSVLVDIEDFTRRSEEWEYKKLIGSRSGTTPPPPPPSLPSHPSTNPHPSLRSTSARSNRR